MFHVKHPMQLSDLFDFLKASKYPISKEQISLFEQYINLIRKWSSRVRLISNNDLDHIVERHILPCLLLHYNIEINKEADLLDIGSGAGFPGLVLKIMQPDLKVVLLDSVRKKCLFLREVSESLKIECDLICQRAEYYNQKQVRQFDVVVNRAVAPLDVLWSWAQPILKEGGLFFAMKGGDCSDEIAAIHMNKIATEVVYPSNNWIEFSRFLKGKTIIKIVNPLLI